MHLPERAGYQPALPLYFRLFSSHSSILHCLARLHRALDLSSAVVASADNTVPLLKLCMQRRLLLTAAAVVLPLAVVLSYYHSADMASAAASVAEVAPTATPLSFVLLGATGRTGLPFMRQALARGHRVTGFTRSMSKIPAELISHPNLTAVEVELDQADKIAAAIANAKPDVVYTMLASDPAPHTALSMGNRAAHSALRSMRETATRLGDATTAAKPTPFIAIGAWGLGPTGPLIKRWYERAVILTAVKTFYAPMARDAALMLSELDAAAADGLIQPILLMPPLLTRGKRTSTYEFGDALTEMSGKMHVFDSVSRDSMADLALSLGEKAVTGQPIPKFVALRQP